MTYFCRVNITTRRFKVCIHCNVVPALAPQRCKLRCIVPAGEGRGRAATVSSTSNHRACVDVRNVWMDACVYVYTDGCPPCGCTCVAGRGRGCGCGDGAIGVTLKAVCKFKDVTLRERTPSSWQVHHTWIMRTGLAARQVGGMTYAPICLRTALPWCVRPWSTSAPHKVRLAPPLVVLSPLVRNVQCSEFRFVAWG